MAAVAEATLDRGRRAGAFLMVIGLMAVLFAAVAPGADAALDNGACNGITGAGDEVGELVKSTSPVGGTSAAPVHVAPGTVITATLTWNAEHWRTINQIEDCVYTGGTAADPFGSLNADLSTQEKPGTNDGSLVHSYTVPNLADGTLVCDRGRMSGFFTRDAADETGTSITVKSVQTVCFTVDSAATTTTTSTTSTSTSTTSTTQPTTTTTSTSTTSTTQPTTTTTSTSTTSTTQPTTTTTLSSTTSTTVPRETTTTVGGSCCGPTPTTSTTQPSTTTSVNVLGTTIVNNTSTTQAPTTTEAVAGTQLTQATSAVKGVQLARTGDDSRQMVFVAGLALLLGGAAILAGDRLASATK